MGTGEVKGTNKKPQTPLKERPVAANGSTEDCYVRALYPFSSTESSSLEFKSGDFIRVLTKLESGWWDGLLNGKRGWFPSNYVEEVELVSSDEDDSDDDEELPDRDRLLSTSYTSASLSSSQYLSIPSMGDLSISDAKDDPDGTAFWIPQTSSEGHIYFFNTVTGTSTWELPLKAMTNKSNFHATDKFTTPITTGLRPPVNKHHLAMPSPNPQRGGSDRFESFEQILTPKSHAASSTLGWRDANGDDLLAVESPVTGESDGEILLFATPTEPTRTDHRRSQTNRELPDGRETDFRDDSVNLPTVPHEAGDISDILLPYSQRFSTTLEKLKVQVQVQARVQYREICGELQDITRETLQKLGLPQHSIDAQDGYSGESEASSWRPVYDKILAALSALLASAQIAGGDWSTSDEAQKLLMDATELQGDYLSLITGVLTNTISLPESAISSSLFPIVLPSRTTAGGWQGNALVRERSNTSSTSVPMVQLSSEAVTDLQNFNAMIQTGIKICKGRLRRHDQGFTPAIGSTVLRDAIDVLGKVRQMLAYCEQVDLSPLDPVGPSDLARSPTISDFATSKQALYDASAALVLAAQGVTSLAVTNVETSQSEPIARLNSAFAVLENAASSVILNFEFMVQEYVAKYGALEGEVILGSEPVRRGSKSTRSLTDGQSLDSPIILAASSFSTPGTTTRSTFLSNSSNTQTPWFLEHELESELSYDSRGNVKAGTLVALVERLTRHDSLDSVYNNTFLLTYRSFTTADELSSLLMQRFLIEAPRGLTSAQQDIWTEHKQRPVQLRVYNIFKSWMENFFVEPPNDATRDWLGRLKQFVQSVMSEQIMNADILAKLIEKRIVQGDVPFRKMILNTTSQPPMPIVPRNLKKIRLLDIDALEVARQLTIMESNLYNRIKPTECLDKSWSKPDAAEGAENIKAMILHSNQITAWVAEAILYQTDLKKRVNLIKHFVFIAEKCRQIHNFSALTAIISGLNSAPIHRLRRTWDLLPARAAVSAEDLNRLMNSSKNFSSYRDALHQTQPPCVPFLGVYLTDLTFIEDGNPNMSIKARHLINISKRQKTADVIREIQQYQAVPYCLQPVPEIQAYIRSCMDITRDISELYNISLEREPREREDEKIARLLQESGFL